jgi:hypothetical protein
MNMKHHWKNHTSFEKQYSWKWRYSWTIGHAGTFEYSVVYVECNVSELKQLTPRKTRGNSKHS